MILFMVSILCSARPEHRDLNGIEFRQEEAIPDYHLYEEENRKAVIATII